MLSLIALVLIAAAIYVAAVELVRIFGTDEDSKALTRQAAAAKVRMVIRDYIKENTQDDSNQQIVCYNIFPGMNASGVIIPDDAERDLSTLLGQFTVAYLQNHCWHSSNTYLYIFNVFDFIEDIEEDMAKLDYLAKLAESDVQKVAHRRYPGVNFSHLTTVELQGSVLYLYVAQNPKGSNEVMKLHYTIRNSLAANSTPTNQPDIEI